MFTPLTAMQSELDVAIHKPRSEDAYRDTFQTMRQHTRPATAMSDEPMAPSEAEAISGADATTPVDLSARAGGRRFRSRAERRDIDLAYSGSDELWVRAQGEHIRVAVQADGDAAVLHVADDGIGVDPQEANRLAAPPPPLPPLSSRTGGRRRVPVVLRAGRSLHIWSAASSLHCLGAVAGRGVSSE